MADQAPNNRRPLSFNQLANFQTLVRLIAHKNSAEARLDGLVELKDHYIEVTRRDMQETLEECNMVGDPVAEMIQAGALIKFVEESGIDTKIQEARRLVQQYEDRIVEFSEIILLHQLHETILDELLNS